MWSRRGFLCLLGGAAPAIWLASTGLVQLDRRFVLAMAGSCSFCGKERDELRALTGVTGRITRICDECVGFCCDILAEEEGIVLSERPPTPPPATLGHDPAGDPILRELREALRTGQIDAAVYGEKFVARIEEIVLADREPIELPEFICSFCDAHRRDVRKLISGPRVFICDRCVGDAAAVVSRVLRA